MHFVAREVVGSLVVGTDSSWKSQRLVWVSMSGTWILEQVLDIRLSELSIETEFHVFNFSHSLWVFLVFGGLIQESLVKSSVQQKVEVGHESGVISILVLGENRLKSHVHFSTHSLVLWFSLGAVLINHELEYGVGGDAPDVTDYTTL